MEEDKTQSSITTQHDRLITVHAGSWTPSLNYTLPLLSFIAILLVIFIIVTALGNLLVAIALYRYRHLRTVSNYLIGNLAVSDFLLAVLVLPLSTVNECLGRWVFGRIVCNLWLVTDVLCCTASIWNLCIIAFDRFTATLYPVWYRDKRSTKQAIIYVGTVWLISVFVCVPPLLGWNDLTDNYVYDNTTLVHQCVLFQTPSYVIYSANGSFFLPFLLTLALYVAIFASLRARMMRMRRKNSGACLTAAVIATEMVLSDQSRDSLMNSRMFISSHGDKPDNCENLVTIDQEGVNLELPTATSDRINRVNSKVLHQRTNIDTFSSVGRSNTHDDHNEKPVFEVETESLACTLRGMKDETLNSSSAAARRSSSSMRLFSESTCPLRNGSDASTHLPYMNGASSNGLRRSVCRKTTNDRPDRRSSSIQRCEQREMRATIRMAIIITFFSGMWLGFFLIYTIRGCCPACLIPRELDTVFFWLGYSNSSVNPILYTIFNDDFKRAFVKILSCRGSGGLNMSGRKWSFDSVATSRKPSTTSMTFSTWWHHS